MTARCVACFAPLPLDEPPTSERRCLTCATEDRAPVVAIPSLWRDDMPECDPGRRE